MDDVLTFAAETPSPKPEGGAPWKILIADDEPSVHLVTKLALGDFTFEGRRLELLSAYGEEDTRRLLREHSDIALMLLDVVMDTITSGFDLVRYIRDDLKNKDVRIIMRTGQSGNAPEDRIIINYDINDFKDKTELTVAKLRTTMISSLRTYSHLRIIEEEQRKSATHRVYLRSIINSLSSVVVTLDQDFRVILWNHQAELFTGVSEANASGRDFFQVSPFFLPLKALCEEVLATGASVERASVPLQKDQTSFVQLSVQPLMGGPSPEILFRLDDRTEAKRHDEQMARNQKLSNFSALASGFTQELDRVLTRLQAEADKLPSPDAGVQALSRQALGMVRQMVRFSHSRDHSRQPMDLVRLISEKVSALEVPQGVRIEWKPGTGSAMFEGNPDDWNLVLDNLVSNSFDAMTWMPGAEDLRHERILRLALTLRSLNDADRPNRPELDGSAYWEFAFADTGVGMPDEVASQAMDPYFTTKPQGKGVGLGLPLVFTIVELHGGVLELKSRPGEGTTVTICLPASVDRATAPAPLGGLVLLCDDEPLMRQVTGKILKKMGFTILEAPDGNSAIELFRQNQDKLALVILDMILPGKTGLEVFRELHALQPRIPVLLSSGFGRGDTVNQALGEGVAGFLQKPFGFESLGQAVRKALEKR